MNRHIVLIVWELFLSLAVLSYECQVQYVNKEKQSEFCKTCKKEEYGIEVCSQATGRPNRFRNMSVLKPETVVLTKQIVGNRTEIEVNVSREYSPILRGYLFIFLMDDGRMLCGSAMFPKCNEPMASFSLAVDGISSMPGVEMHQLLSAHAVTLDWISDVIISRSNASYLKVTFDVKSQNVKWYTVELWDSHDNLIKSERTEKNYVIFRNITAGTYYTVVRILEMVEGSPSPCRRDVTDKSVNISCTDKRSKLFEFPLNKTAEHADQKPADDTSLVLSISLAFGGILVLSVISVVIIVSRKHGSKRMLQRKRSSVSLIIVATKCVPNKILRKLEKTLISELNVNCKKLIISRRKIVPIYQISTDIILVILSRNSLDRMSTVFEKPDRISEKTVVFVKVDDTDSSSMESLRYPTFDISSDSDSLVKFLSIGMTSRDNKGKIRENVSPEFYGPCSNRVRSNLSFPNKEREESVDVNSVAYEIDSVSKTVLPVTLGGPPVPRYSYTSHSDLGDSEVSTIFTSRSWFLPPNMDSDMDSAYVTQSECMKQINNSYDAFRRTKGNNPSSPEVEAVSLGERSV